MFYELYIKLLAKRIEGINIDKVMAEYFENRYPNRISLYTDVLEENNYVFWIQKKLEKVEIKKSNNYFLKLRLLREWLYMKNDQRLIQSNYMSIKHLLILMKKL